MSTIEIEKVGERIDDVYKDIPCDCCVASGHMPVGVGDKGVRWIAPGCCRDKRTYLFCDNCPRNGPTGPCKFCGIVGTYEVVA